MEQILPESITQISETYATSAQLELIRWYFIFFIYWENKSRTKNPKRLGYYCPDGLGMHRREIRQLKQT